MYFDYFCQYISHFFPETFPFMSFSSIKRGIILSMSSYLLLAFLVVVSLKYIVFQDFLLYYILAWTLLIIRDIIALSGISDTITHRVVDWRSFWNDRRTHSISLVDIFLFLNRTIFFPSFLIFYIILILLKQLDIFGFSDTLLSYSWIEYSLLGCVALTGLSTIFHEFIDDRYYKVIKHYGRTRRFIILTIVLWLVGTAIIFRETSSLWFLSIPISIISWILIFLIGILLLEENEESTIL